MSRFMKTMLFSTALASLLLAKFPLGRSEMLRVALAQGSAQGSAAGSTQGSAQSTLQASGPAPTGVVVAGGFIDAPDLPDTQLPEIDSKVVGHCIVDCRLFQKALGVEDIGTSNSQCTGGAISGAWRLQVANGYVLASEGRLESSCPDSASLDELAFDTINAVMKVITTSPDGLTQEPVQGECKVRSEPQGVVVANSNGWSSASQSLRFLVGSSSTELQVDELAAAHSPFVLGAVQGYTWGGGASGGGYGGSASGGATNQGLAGGGIRRESILPSAQEETAFTVVEVTSVGALVQIRLWAATGPQASSSSAQAFVSFWQPRTVSELHCGTINSSGSYAKVTW